MLQAHDRVSGQKRQVEREDSRMETQRELRTYDQRRISGHGMEMLSRLLGSSPLPATKKRVGLVNGPWVHIRVTAPCPRSRRLEELHKDPVDRTDSR